MTLVVFLVGLLGLVFLKVPIAFALIATTFILYLISPTAAFSLMEIVRNYTRGVESFPLLAIPFFMLAGEIMNHGGMSQRIVKFCSALIGHVTGGLGYVSVLSSMVFAGISGSGVADTAAIGSIMLPIMKKNKYDTGESAALLAAGGCIGPIIPPSIPMIIYATVAEVSIIKLFLGGIIPGLLIGLGLMAVWYFYSKKRGYKRDRRATTKELFIATKESILALVLPAIILGSVVFGFATATESGVIAVAYALMVCLLIYKEIKLSDLPKLFVNAANSTATILFIVGAATAAAHIITLARIPDQILEFLISISNNVYVIMLLINILLLLVGCVMELIPALLILAPILIPIANKFGLDLVYFGVVISINLCLGLITPPVGDCLYLVSKLGDVDVLKVIKAILPMVAIMIAVLLLVTYFPILITFIPSLM